VHERSGADLRIVRLTLGDDDGLSTARKRGVDEIILGIGHSSTTSEDGIVAFRGLDERRVVLTDSVDVTHRDFIEQNDTSSAMETAISSGLGNHIGKVHYAATNDVRPTGKKTGNGDEKYVQPRPTRPPE
jgi:hypothetical protein